MTFAPEYIDCVLRENFTDAQAQLLSPLMAIHYAHLVMLVEREIIPQDDAHRLREALDSISEEDVRAADFNPDFEDLFFYVDGLISDACGADAAGRLHTARSRNDIDMTMYRMRQREFILDLSEATQALRRSLIDSAGRHRETIFAAHTHTQPAQPTTVAHYLLAIIEQLERDQVRLRAAYESTNRNPLGACAFTGTGFPIDRNLTSELLGFSGPTGNTYGSIATVDYLLESASAAAVSLAGLGRVIQNLLLWCTVEFDYLRLEDGFVQSSSIMPQKRNPVALEHARIIASRALGQATAILISVHNTPFGDIVDTEDDLQPLVFSMFRDATRATRLVAAVMRRAEFNTARLQERAYEGWITATELADTFTREHGLPFGASHAITGRLVAARERDPAVSVPEALAAVSTQVLGAPLPYSAQELEQVLSPRHFVEVRRTHGGPAPSETARALAESEATLADDARWATAAHEALAAATEQLRERAAQL